MPAHPKPVRKKKEKIPSVNPKKVAHRQVASQLLAESIAELEAINTSKGIKNRCLACIFDVRLPNGSSGTMYATDWNHCIPRSRLPGTRNLAILHSKLNLAHVCRAHHDAYDRLPEFWLPIMRRIYGFDYSQNPFKRYIDNPHYALGDTVIGNE